MIYQLTKVYYFIRGNRFLSDDYLGMTGKLFNRRMGIPADWNTRTNGNSSRLEYPHEWEFQPTGIPARMGIPADWKRSPALRIASVYHSSTRAFQPFSAIESTTCLEGPRILDREVSRANRISIYISAGFSNKFVCQRNVY